LLRSSFKVLETGIIYLDSAAKSLTPVEVVKAVEQYYVESNANAGRSVHRLSRIATDCIDTARSKIAGIVHASSEEVMLLRNTTEAIGVVCHGLEWNSGDEIVTTLGEHHSNYLPWLRLQEKFGVRVIAVRPMSDGTINLEDIKKSISPGKTKLVALAHVTNTLGTIVPVREICGLAREAGALSLIDGAQSVPHLETDVKKIGCDFLAWSGHKMFGPTGTGALYCRSPLMNQLIPLHAGGGVIKNVSPNSDSFTFNYSPPYTAHECGTPNISGIIGFGEAADFLRKCRKDSKLIQESSSLPAIASRELRAIPRVHVAGSIDSSKFVSIVSFWIEGISPHRTAAILDEEFGIFVRSGHHCALPFTRDVLKRPRGIVRASFHYYSTITDVESLVKAVNSIARSTF